MHCAKNLSENLSRTTFGEKDSAAVRVDMQARGIRPHLHLQPIGPNQEMVAHARCVICSFYRRQGKGSTSIEELEDTHKLCLCTL